MLKTPFDPPCKRGGSIWGVNRPFFWRNLVPAVSITLWERVEPAVGLEPTTG
jgi:hypothetical protein